MCTSDLFPFKRKLGNFFIKLYLLEYGRKQLWGNKVNWSS